MAAATKTVKVLIVDDHPVVRLGLRTMLESEENISAAGTAGSAKEALAEVQKLQPDVVLMDWSR
jgi:DNA-binding NarL/FixJ family response regulator